MLGIYVHVRLSVVRLFSVFEKLNYLSVYASTLCVEYLEPWELFIVQDKWSKTTVFVPYVKPADTCSDKLTVNVVLWNMFTTVKAFGTGLLFIGPAG